MREIKAVIQPFLLPKVVCGLLNIDHFPGITITKVTGFGKRKDRETNQPCEEDLVEYQSKVKIEIVVPDEMAEEVVQTIQNNAHTGKKGDGKIWVTDLLEIVKISTGKRGERAV
jgi:nitrogen regulatory protein P-II 1